MVAIVSASCSSSDNKATDVTTTSATSASTTSSTIARPEGPVADITAEIVGDQPPFMGESSPTRLDDVGYTQNEYFATGEATSYAAKQPLTGDGQWVFTNDATAEYRTRIVVRRPTDVAKFSGTVVVEWLNVSGGLDASPDWTSLHEELTREGHVWVGVSAQRIGVEGGPVLVSVPGVGADIVGKGLKKIDAARYSTLQHPGDGFSFDMFTQIARAVRKGGDPLGGAQPSHLVAAGESQSAFALVTYINGVQPLTKAFDGFFVHSRGAFGLPLVQPGAGADIAGSLASTPTILRSDTTVPIMELQSETDIGSLLNSRAARQPDTSRFRLWEVAGTAHADRHLMGTVADGLDCGAPVNDGPLHVVAKASFHALNRWMRDGTEPATAERVKLVGGKADGDLERDADGIVLGGIRTPAVDVPAVVLSGVPGPNPSIICLLLGSTKPLPGKTAVDRYESKANYEKLFSESADAAIKAGFVLEADRKAMLSYMAYPAG